MNVIFYWGIVPLLLSFIVLHLKKVHRILNCEKKFLYWWGKTVEDAAIEASFDIFLMFSFSTSFTFLSLYFSLFILISGS